MHNSLQQMAQVGSEHESVPSDLAKMSQSGLKVKSDCAGMNSLLTISSASNVALT
jgi:hypothetical protein